MWPTTSSTPFASTLTDSSRSPLAGMRTARQEATILQRQAKQQLEAVATMMENDDHELGNKAGRIPRRLLRD